jgi:hypothetical protein
MLVMLAVARFVVALGLLLAQGPMLLHLLLIPHTTCEHGELVETSVVHASWDETSVRSATGAPAIEQAHEGRREHTHCDALALRHRVTELATPVAEASLLAVLSIDRPRDLAEVRPVALLSLAPKASPPLA